MSKNTIVTAGFRDPRVAQEAFEWLQSHGYRSSDINILMSEKTRQSFKEEHDQSRIGAGSMVSEGIAAGGAIGTAVGATLATVAAVGTILVPGLGVIAGPLVAALAGGGAGAVTGGIIGGLVGLGIPESNAKAYEEVLRNGGVVLGVHPRSSADRDAIKKHFNELNADNIVCS